MLQEVSKSESVPRVAIVTGSLPLGGSTIFVCNLAGELMRRRIPVAVFSFGNENPLASDFQELRIPLITQDERKAIYEDRMQSVLRGLADFRPTAVLSNIGSEAFETLRYVPNGVFRAGIVHSDDSKVYGEIAHYSQFLDALGCVSKTIEGHLKAILEFQDVPVAYMPCGVPMPETFIERLVENQPLKILYLGRLEQEPKRVRLFPAIFEKLRSAGIPFTWTIAGEGPERDFLEQRMKSSLEQVVRFTGKISYAEVPRCLEENNIFLLASNCEGLPLSLLEAMGRGLVPVVTDLPSGISELVDQSNGIKVPVDNIEGYAEGILWLHAHRSKMKDMSLAARAKVKNDFSISAMTERWLALFARENQPEKWPFDFGVQPILCGKRGAFYYSGPVKILRRIVKKWKQ